MSSMQASHASHYASVGLNFGVLLFCIIPTWIVLSQLEDHTTVVNGLEADEPPELDGKEMRSKVAEATPHLQ